MERKEFINSIQGLTKEELVQIIKNNFTDRWGCIDIRGLDFDGKRLDIRGMKAKEINQSKHITDIIYQDEHKAVFISQSKHNAYEIEQNKHTAVEINQREHTANKVLEGGHKERED